jgi:hypothetical protein
MKPINLNQVRKTRKKVAAKASADENAVKFGRTKAQRVLEAARSSKMDAHLSQMKFESE